MFTGIVTDVGTVVARTPREGAVEFAVRAPKFARELEDGDSVAVDGVCFTVTDREGDEFRFTSVLTTLGRTTFEEIETGRRVNLERALRAGDPLGGHMVQGHVDGVGHVTALEHHGETVLVGIRLPPDVAALTVPRGSLAVDGVSLTVAELEGEVAEIALIPYTWTHTSLDRLEIGDRVNLEADLIGKYVERLLAPYVGGTRGA